MKRSLLPDGYSVACQRTWGRQDFITTLVSYLCAHASVGETKGLGGYSDYTLADERICFPVPDGITPEQGATVPLAACTALMALFSKDCLDIVKNSGEPVLAWGGSCKSNLKMFLNTAEEGEPHNN